MSDSNRVSLAYIAETVYGVTPTTPTLKALRFIEESFKKATETQRSKEIRADRQAPDVIRTMVKAQGDLSFELIYSAYDDFIAAAVGSAGWSAQVSSTATTISAATADNSLNSAAVNWASAGFQANQWVKISGFATAGNNGYAKIASITGSGPYKMVLSHFTLAAVEATGPSVTVKMGPQIVNGVASPSFVFEKTFNDIASVFAVYNGMCVEEMKLKIEANQILTGAFTFMGKDEVGGSSTISTGGTPTAAPTGSVMNTIDHVVSVLENGASFPVKAANLATKANLRNRLIVGSLGPASMGVGSFEPNGSLQAYFSSQAVMTEYRNFTASSCAFVLQDAAGSGYVFEFPRMKFTDGNVLAKGKNDDVLADMKFEAYMHATEGITMRVARFV